MPIKSEKPLDYSGQVWRGIDDKFPKKIHNATTTSDGLMSAEDKAKLDSIDANDDNRVYDVATPDSDGLLSKDDKKILDGLNSYYEYLMENGFKHVTDENITYWNDKADKTVATQSENGLMSAEDKTKLDTVEENANNYIHPDTHPATMIVEDETHRFVTDTQISSWNNKAEKSVATQRSDGLMSAVDKIKLDNIQEGANNYVHPNNEGIRHVSDAEKDYWNSKADKIVVTNSENGLMSYIDKIKLDGIEPGANKYVHPDDSTHRHVTDEQIKFWDSKGGNDVATQTRNGLMSFSDKVILDKLAIIDKDMEDKHFVTTEEKEYWNSKINLTDLVTHEKDGLMSSEDKIKLDEIEENANNYIHPDDENTRHVTDEQIAYWNDKASTTLVSSSNHGLMISADKVKLDTVEEYANYYIHPDNIDTRHVSDAEKQIWNNKADNTVVTLNKHGLMSINDKKKLDTVEENANNYIHPDTHPATMIVEDETHRFVTDEEKEKWNNVIVDLATPETDGLMSAEDKTKIDQLIAPQTHELTLVYSEWSDEEPYTQTLNVPGISPDLNAYIGINSTATVDEMVTAAEAKLKVGSVEQDKITIIATGIKPDKNLPVIIMAGSSILIFEVKQFNGREEYAYEAPTTGLHYQNEIVYSYRPIQTGCIGWVCSETGEPGEWLPFGTVEITE